MNRIYAAADQLIGHTPLLELTHIEKELGLEAKIIAKLEYLNPAGSVKDRVAKAMIDDAEAKGLLKPGSVIIEPTSGNTGIGLASVAAARGYRIIIVTPETMSVEQSRRPLCHHWAGDLDRYRRRRGLLCCRSGHRRHCFRRGKISKGEKSQSQSHCRGAERLSGTQWGVRRIP